MRGGDGGVGTDKDEGVILCIFWSCPNVLLEAWTELGLCAVNGFPTTLLAVRKVHSAANLP